MDKLDNKTLDEAFELLNKHPLTSARVVMSRQDAIEAGFKVDDEKTPAVIKDGDGFRAMTRSEFIQLFGEDLLLEEEAK